MNEEKFTDIADMYTKYRPPYPEAFLKYLYSDVGLSSESTIADVGSGTGIFTEMLLRRKSKVFAIEPNEHMREISQKNLASFKNCILVDAQAEDTALYNSSVDFVTVAQAFHWFDKLKFKTECRRILKDNGKVILVWNDREATTDFMLENAEINKRYCPNFKGFSNGRKIEDDYEHMDFFSHGTYDFKMFKNDLTYSENDFIGRCLSSSYALRQQDKNYYMYINTLKSLFKKYSNNGYLYLPNTTKSYIGKVNPVI